MKEIYSNAMDCHELSKLLKNNLKNEIDYYGSTYQGVIIGRYLNKETNSYNYYDTLDRYGIPFNYKFNKYGFLRISIGSLYHSKGEVLAALSDFYETIKKEYGEPTFLYTIKDDTSNSINLQWSFVNKNEDIKDLKNGTYFDDAEIDKYIIIGNKNIEKELNISEKERQVIEDEIGLPIELIGLIKDNEEEYFKYKNKVSSKQYRKQQKRT